MTATLAQLQKSPVLKEKVTVNARLTPTQQKIWDLLSDGRIHTMTEVGKCLWDELSRLDYTVPMHMTRIRDLVNPEGYDIIGRKVYGECCYILVKFLVPQPVLCSLAKS